MSWDYTETQQLLHSMGDLSVAPAQTEANVLNVETAPPSPSLHLIYQIITSQHKQTQRDSKKARVATKQLQVAISKVAKTCSEIGERIAAIECRADALESDLGAVTKQAAMHESQLSDIQWKVEDFENRQRRNNLRLIGIQEGVEGQDSRAFIIRLLKTALPEQTGWDWEKEIQRAHRGTAPPGVLWDALKAAIRGETLSYALKREKQRHLAISAAQTELASLESQIVGLARNNAPIQDTLDKITVTRAKIIQLYLDQDIIKAQIRTQECYEFSERVGKVLAYKTRQKAARSAIVAIKDRQGQTVYGDRLTHREVEITPQLVLLGTDGVAYPEYSQRFLFLAMSVARCCIASNWLESTPPTFNHWLVRMCSLFYLEMGSYACKGRRRRRMGEAIWAQWLGNNESGS
ncbi:hypothetical protein NDU88_003877 [Pleurodeles waltl]|uniref:Uncharacterized protein n=1 Tax=Pleurodeles waltl TaxID=8319 RepID=A0AAV7RHV7_PLEWA|nr:hypothetical protein NDU88_003877 [Pleurodeles waltl]